MLKVALFPIPNVVAFPGVPVPLHVFEPRYRKLVNECVEAERMVGVCHVTKTIRQAPESQSLEDALSSNQATYQPQEVFTAGFCQVRSVLEDGRILAEIDMRERLTLLEDVQILPYRIVACERLDDIPDPGHDSANETLKSNIHGLLRDILENERSEMRSELDSVSWSDLTPGEFSFRIFRVIRFDPDTMQQILESRNVHDRLQNMHRILLAVASQIR